MIPPSPPLTIEKRVSILDGKVLVEYIPKARVLALIKSKKLALNWDLSIYSHQNAAQLYANETLQMKEYLKLYKDDGFQVKYFKPKHKWGRVMVHKSLGLTAFGRVTRNTLINGLYIDLDIKNAQPEIIRNICKSQTPPIPCPMIEEYCLCRKEIFTELANQYSMEVWQIKKLFLRLCFFGTFKGWCKEMKTENLQPHTFITQFERELRDIAEITKKANPVLYETARKSKEAKNEKNYIGSFYALYLQEYELRILEAVINTLMEDTEVMNHPTVSNAHVGAYEYDGLKLLKENVEKFEGGKDGLIAFIQQKTTELTGFELVWEEKPIDEYHDIEEWIRDVEDTNKRDESMREELSNIRNKFDDTGVIETIMALFPNQFVFSKEKWYGWNGTKWESNDRPLRSAIMYRIPEHWRNKIKEWKEKYPIDHEYDENNDNHKDLKSLEKELEKFITQHLRDHTQQTKCVGQGKVLLANDELEFDNNPDLLGFKNGVWDNEEECFRPYRFDDYVTWSCGWNFSPVLKDLKYEVKEGNQLISKVVEKNLEVEKMNALKTMMATIFPDEEVLNLVLFVLASGLVGKAIEKFFIFNGKGRNGKGLINEFMNCCLGDYFEYVSPTILTENQKNKDSRSANPELAKIDKKRYVVLKEPSKNQPLHNNVIKDMTGGGEVQARKLYSSSSKISLHLTMVMECNKKPPFAENPEDADAERVVDILFGSKFTSDNSELDTKNHIYPVNTEYKNSLWKDDHKNVFVNMLLSYLIILKNEAHYVIDKYIPENVKLRGQEYLQDSMDIHKLFMALFEKRSMNPKRIQKYHNAKRVPKDEDWTVSAIANEIRQSSDFHKLGRNTKESKEMKVDGIKEFFKTNKFYKTFIYHNRHSKQIVLKGWRFKPVGQFGEVLEDEDYEDENDKDNENYNTEEEIGDGGGY